MSTKTSITMLIIWIWVTSVGASQAGARPYAAPPASLDSELMGMVIRDPWYDFGTYPGLPDEPNRVAQERMGAILEDSGVRWVRFEFFVSGDGAAALEHSFARYDFFINEVAPRHNLKILGLLSFGVVSETDPLDPNNGITAGNFTADPLYGGGVNPYMRRWLERSLAIADRYQGKVAAYEVLNEQNRLPPNGDAVPAYLAARLHTKFYRMIKQTPGRAPWNASVQIIVGGLHPKGTLDPTQKGYLSDESYLRQLYGYSAVPPPPGTVDAPEPTAPFQEYRTTYGAYPLDGLGYHPYPEEIRLSLQADSDLINDRLSSIRTTLSAVGDPARRFWITEIGYNIAFKQQDITGQAAFMREVYTMLAARGDVSTIFWFKYEDFPPADGSNAQKWGIVRIPFTESDSCLGGACYAVDGAPSEYRLSYFTYRELAGRPVYRAWMPTVAR